MRMMVYKYYGLAVGSIMSLNTFKNTSDKFSVYSVSTHDSNTVSSASMSLIAS